MHNIIFILQNFIFYKMVENCWGGSGYSAETPGRLGFKGLKMVKILLGQQSTFTKFPRYHGRWDAAMTDYCWTLERDLPAANFSKSSKKRKFKQQLYI